MWIAGRKRHLAHDGRVRLWTIKLDPADFPGYIPFCVNNLISQEYSLKKIRLTDKNWSDLT